MEKTVNMKLIPKPLLESYTKGDVGGYAKDVLGLDESDIEKALESLARKWGGCIRCKHSRAHPDSMRQIIKKGGHLDLMLRTCALGLAQGNCGSYSPFM